MTKEQMLRVREGDILIFNKGNKFHAKDLGWHESRWVVGRRVSDDQEGRYYLIGLDGERNCSEYALVYHCKYWTYEDDFKQWVEDVRAEESAKLTTP